MVIFPANMRGIFDYVPFTASKQQILWIYFIHTTLAASGLIYCSDIFVSSGLVQHTFRPYNRTNINK
jgi:hypothetical protein